jgi:hypothetical protein
MAFISNSLHDRVDLENDQTLILCLVRLLYHVFRTVLPCQSRCAPSKIQTNGACPIDCFSPTGCENLMCSFLGKIFKSLRFCLHNLVSTEDKGPYRS